MLLFFAYIKRLRNYIWSLPIYLVTPTSKNMIDQTWSTRILKIKIDYFKWNQIILKFCHFFFNKLQKYTHKCIGMNFREKKRYKSNKHSKILIEPHVDISMLHLLKCTFFQQRKVFPFLFKYSRFYFPAQNLNTFHNPCSLFFSWNIYRI